MRDIIFRGKRKDNGEWVEGGLCIINKSPFICYEMVKGLPKLTEVEENTVGQYTGLTDKNGTKIFEGDIVFISGDVNETCVCVWEEDNFDYEFENETMDIYICGVHKDEVEVIGNIHDNPELLGDK